jgi:hypothetical protein
MLVDSGMKNVVKCFLPFGYTIVTGWVTEGTYMSRHLEQSCTFGQPSVAAITSSPESHVPSAPVDFTDFSAETPFPLPCPNPLQTYQHTDVRILLLPPPSVGPNIQFDVTISDKLNRNIIKPQQSVTMSISFIFLCVVFYGKKYKQHVNRYN